jgi:hypothetical protein
MFFTYRRDNNTPFVLMPDALQLDPMLMAWLQGEHVLEIEAALLLRCGTEAQAAALGAALCARRRIARAGARERRAAVGVALGHARRALAAVHRRAAQARRLIVAPRTADAE